MVSFLLQDLCDGFDVILGNSFMASHRAVLDYSNYNASLRRHGRQFTLFPRSISADKGGLPSQLPEPNFRDACKTVPLRDSKARHNGFSDQNAKYTDQLGGPDPKLVLSCAQARKSIQQGCRSFLVLVTHDQAEIANATLGVEDVRESVSSSSPAAAPATADPEQAHLLQLIDALQQRYSDVFAEPSGLPSDRGWNMSFPYYLILSLLSSECTGWRLLSCKRCSGRSLICWPSSLLSLQPVHVHLVLLSCLWRRRLEISGW